MSAEYSLKGNGFDREGWAKDADKHLQKLFQSSGILPISFHEGMAEPGSPAMVEMLTSGQFWMIPVDGIRGMHVDAVRPESIVFDIRSFASKADFALLDTFLSLGVARGGEAWAEGETMTPGSDLEYQKHWAMHLPLHRRALEEDSGNHLTLPVCSFSLRLSEMELAMEPEEVETLLISRAERASVEVPDQPSAAVTHHASLVAPLVAGGVRDSTREKSLEVLTKMPIYVFLYVAGVDGEIDDDEGAAFFSTLADEQFTAKSKMFDMAASILAGNFQAIFDDVMKNDAHNIATHMGKAAGVIELFITDPEERSRYKQCLMELGTKIAEASGGGLFKSSVSKVEKKALDALAKALQFDGSA